MGQTQAARAFSPPLHTSPLSHKIEWSRHWTGTIYVLQGAKEFASQSPSPAHGCAAGNQPARCFTTAAMVAVSSAQCDHRSPVKASGSLKIPVRGRSVLLSTDPLPLVSKCLTYLSFNRKRGQI